MTKRGRGYIQAKGNCNDSCELYRSNTCPYLLTGSLVNKMLGFTEPFESSQVVQGRINRYQGATEIKAGVLVRILGAEDYYNVPTNSAGAPIEQAATNREVLDLARDARAMSQAR